jgi:Zn-dependent protease
MAYTLITLLVFSLSIGFVLVWSVARQLMNRRIRLGRIEWRPASELPERYRAAFEGPLEVLRELGFREADCQLAESVFGGAAVPKWALTCINEKDRVIATIHVPERLDLASHHIIFASRDSGGTRFSSFGWQSHLYIKGLQKWLFQDTHTTDWREGFRIHLRSRLGAVPDPIIPDAVTRARQAEEEVANYVKFLFDTGRTRRVSNDEYRFKFLPAMRLAVQVLIGESRSRRYLKRAKLASTGSAEAASPELQAEAYRRFEALVSEARPVHWAVKLAVFIVSAIIFCVVFELTLALSLTTVLLFAVAIFVHELGHLTGMWIFGYRDLQIFFIPAFGAMTTGVEHHVLPWQRVVMTLLGPLPGLVLSGMLLLTMDISPGSWLFQLLMIALAINYINLLPVVPFDGGVIVETAIAQRFPYISSVLTLISAVVCGALGIYLREAVLIVVAVVLFAVVRPKWRLAKAQKLLESHLPDPAGSDDSALHAIFAELSQPLYSKLGFARKVQFAKKLMDYQKSGKPGVLLSYVCLALQILVLAVPLVIALVYYEF